MQSQLKVLIRNFILNKDNNGFVVGDEYGNYWQIGSDGKLYLSTNFSQQLGTWSLCNRVDESGELYRILERENAKDHMVVPSNLAAAINVVFEEVLDFSSKTDYSAIITQELSQILEQYIHCPHTVITERKLQLSPHFKVTVKNKVIEIRNSKWHHSNYDIGLSSNLGPDDVPQVIAIFSPINDSLGFSVALDKPVKESAQLLLSRILDFMN